MYAQIHYLPAGVLDYLVDFMGSNQPVSFSLEKHGKREEKTVDFSQALFLVTTNLGGKETIQKVGE